MFSKKSIFLQDDNPHIRGKNKLSCNLNGQNISFEFRTISPEPQLCTVGQIIYTFGGISAAAREDVKRLIWAAGSYECTMHYHGLNYHLLFCQSEAHNPLVTNTIDISVCAIEKI